MRCVLELVFWKALLCSWNCFLESTAAFVNFFGKQSFVQCDAANKVSQEGVEDGDEFDYIEEEELPSNVSGYIFPVFETFHC